MKIRKQYCQMIGIRKHGHYIPRNTVRAGCAYRPSVTDEARYELGKPIDCSTAQQDIQILENEKAFSSEQAKAGIKMIVPAAAARSILHRDYLNRGEVATGE